MRLKIISKFYDLKFFICIFVSLFILFSWYLVSFEVAPYDDDSSRWIILKKIILTFNDGYYFQYGANVPMEIQWEDPGFAFWTVFYGMLKNITSLFFVLLLSKNNIIGICIKKSIISETLSVLSSNLSEEV